MTEHSRNAHSPSWLEASGLQHLVRTLGLAVHSAKLAIGLCAIVTTFILGFVLDAAWKMGDGVSATAITSFITAHELGESHEEATGPAGIFEVWREHERRCILGLLGSSVPGASVAAGTPVGQYVNSHSRAQPLRNLAEMGYGMLWMLKFHTWYFVFFSLGSLAIWSLAGGAICRIAAVQFARDEKLTIRQALDYSREKFFGGFFLAPCVPLALVLVGSVLLFASGLLLSVPWLGDLLGGVTFVLALAIGLGVSILLLGTLIGGSLFWPTIAAEGSDAFDAFSRGLSYSLSRPFKALLYTVITVVIASLSWVFANLFTFLVLNVTRTVVAFGTSPFGWWDREVDGASVNKMELLWPMSGPNALYNPPDWSQLQFMEHVSAVLVGFYVLLIVALLWSFLASFYFSGSTVIYYLLRRDVDAVDLEDVYMAVDTGDAFEIDEVIGNQANAPAAIESEGAGDKGSTGPPTT